eukprot:15366213-Ditylum_brightwellii.AAC.1
MPSWVCHHAPVTILPPDMQCPKQGYPVCDNAKQKFLPGCSIKSLCPAIPLPHFEELFHQDQQKGQYHKGHLTFCSIFEKHPMLVVQDQIVRHVSAHGLSTLSISTLSKH